MPQTICDKCGTQWGGTNYTSLICPICHHDAEVNKLKSDNWRLNDLSMSLKSVMREMREEINDTQAEIERLRTDLAEARAIVRVYWTLHDRFSMSPEELAEHLTEHPWLEDE